MARKKLPVTDVRDMYTEINAYDREYIINKYGGCGLAIKLLIQGGEYEQALKKIEELERLIK
jgi:hypothetical protein